LGAAGASAARRDTPTLNLGIPSAAATFGVWVLAKQLGFWDKEGVNVNLVENTGGNSLNLLAAGQIDLLAFTGAAATQVALQGKPVSVVYGSSLWPGAALVGNPSITSLAQFRALPSCRVAVAAPGNQTYWQYLVFMRELGLGKKCTPVILTTATLQTQGVVSSAYDASVEGFSDATVAASQGAHILIDPSAPSYVKTWGRNAHLAGVVVGIQSVVKSNPAAIVAFVKGASDAMDYLWTHTDRQVATVLARDPLYAGQSVDLITPQVAFYRPYIGNYVNPTRPGWISDGVWKHALGVYGQYGLQNYDPTSPLIQYSQSVDMSYFDTAYPKPPFVVTAKERTLREIAAAQLGSGDKWSQLYAKNKVWIDALNLPAAKIPDVQLRVGTVVWT
jgi:NitT/TauT family transport system substrate-binding protein